MAHSTIVAPALVQAWRRKTIVAHQTRLTWEKLSNNFTYGQSTPGSSERKMPETVVHKVSDDLDNGSYSVTVLAPRATAMNAIGGGNTALGQEGNNTSKMITVYYNVQRFPLVVGDSSVSGRIAERFYNLSANTAQKIGDLFAKQTDEDHFRALIDGADKFLTDSAYWEDADRPSPISKPLSTVLHPNIYYQINGAATKNTWSATYATALSNLENATDTEFDNDDVFTLASLDIIHLLASRNINPLGGVHGNAEIQWVVVISDAQWYQMWVDTTANASLRDLFKHTDEGYKQLLSQIPGAKGVYANMLIVVSASSPLFNNSSGTATFQYLTSNGEGRTRVAWVDNAGTAELAFCLGEGALMMADVEGIDYEKENLDYNFSKNMCGIRKRGTQRTDLDATVAATSARVNESSFIYMTVTNAAAA